MSAYYIYIYNIIYICKVAGMHMENVVCYTLVKSSSTKAHQVVFSNNTVL